ncbi:MAG: dihydroorotate dehydrogenase electron transfer subunit [Candidatus Micrarchaeia archaeon]
MSKVPSSFPEMVRITKAFEEGTRVKTFVVEKSIKAEPGQLILVWLPGIDEKPFGISNPSPLQFSVAKVGPFSSALHALKEGDWVGVRGPIGRGFRLYKGRILIVAGGYGLAPLRFLVKRAREEGVEYDLIACAKTASELMDVGDALIATDDGSRGKKALATEYAAELIGKNQYECVYACGPEKMLRVIAEMCASRGIRCQVLIERYIKCGIGICDSCAISGLRVCKDGPVFDGEKLLKTEFGRIKRDASGKIIPV